MSDLISREKAIQGVRELFSFGECYRDKWSIVGMLKGLPSAEPEWKKGEWNYIGDDMFKCTCCGVLYTTQQLNGLRNYAEDPYAPRFCPNCGADLRGE